MRLISELRRRNVFRMAVLYAATAWALLEGTDVLSGLVGLPEQFGRMLLIVLAIGFPIALIASWFLELTPEGLALDKDAPDTVSTTPFGGRRMDFVIIAVLSAAVLMFAWDKWVRTGPDDLSIAVLPFENMSADPDQEYFSDGISEDILNLLAQIQPLDVKARTSSFWFKGKDADIQTIAEKLNVRHVLEGSVRRDGNRVRITAQLIDAENSSHLWSQTYDRDLSAASLFHVQSEVARAITSQLKVTLTEPNEQRLAKVPTENLEAYAAYLIGRDRLRDRNVAGLDAAVQQFARAVDLDPEFAGAWSGLRDACFLYIVYAGDISHEQCPEDHEGLIALARKAVALDPELGEAWISLGNALSQSVGTGTGDPEIVRAEAGKALERGLELAPNFSQGYHWYALHLHHFDSQDQYWSDWREGLWRNVIKRGLEVDPLNIQLHYMMQYPEYARTRDEAMWHARRIVEIAPDSVRGYERLGECGWQYYGRAEDMVRYASKAAELDPLHNWYPLHIAYAYTALGDFDMALAYFDRVQSMSDNRKWRIRLGRAWALLHSGRKDEAIAIFESMLWRPDDMLHVLASFDIAAGDSDEALARYRQFAPECFNTDKEADAFFADCQGMTFVGFARVMQEHGDSELMATFVDAWIRRHEEWFEKYLASTEGYEDYGLYEPMAAYAIAGRQDEALSKLETYVEQGWRGYELFEDWRFTAYFDFTLDAIRDHPRFQAAIAVIEADMAQQLENVHAMGRAGEVPTLDEVRQQLSKNGN